MSAIGVFNLTERWHGLKSSFRKRLSDGRDFSYINVGDSIATGRIGIPNKSQHYAAVAAGTAARHLGLPCRLALHTADDVGTDDRVGLSGRGWRIEEGGLYGGGSCIVDAGGEGVLNYFPEPRCRMVRIFHRGGFDYSVDGGTSWSSRHEVAGATQVREQVGWRGHASPSQSRDVRPPDY